MCQLLLEEGALSEDRLVALLGECVTRHGGEAKRAKIVTHVEGGRSRLSAADADEKNRKTLGVVLDALTAQLQPLGMKVAKMKSRADKQLHYGLVNLNPDDALAKAATTLSKSEQEFFHKLVGEILAAESKTVDELDATNSARELTATAKLSPSEARECLAKLKEGKWLTMDDDGNYGLGVRTELQGRYLREMPTAEGPKAEAGPTQGAASGAAEEEVQEID